MSYVRKFMRNIMIIAVCLLLLIASIAQPANAQVAALVPPPCIGCYEGGATLLPFASFLALGMAVTYLNATQKGPTDSFFYKLFPSVEQSYPSPVHKDGV